VPDTFLYFAYGSNMLTRRLTERTASAATVGIGFIEGHRLAFDKVSRDGSGKADIEATGNPTDRVYGVLFRIAAVEERKLDDAEGLGGGYRKGNVQVVTANGISPAVAYIATDKEAACRPYDWYKALVLAGAVEHGLPNAYVEWLRTTHSQTDPNVVRRAENEALLFNS
jgi:gamma-glutamylcyclotransferase